MAASVRLGEARPSFPPVPADWVFVDTEAVAVDDLVQDPVEDPEPIEERRYGITEFGRHALARSWALEPGPSVAEVMARQTHG